MKKITLLFAFIAFSLTSCSSDEPGPQGPQGPAGEPGVNIVGQTFEFEGVDFEYDAEENIYFSGLIDFPAEIEILESDGILVYRRQLFGSTETWTLVPHNFFLEDGIIQYVYTQTDTNIELLIEGNYDLSTLADTYTQDQFFRFIVVPSDFALDTGVDLSNHDAVMQALEL